uniref:Lethal (1) G0222 (inferred by orthology to a D. melanogaster protein) n=1 Tax=Anisakis simplex TaxID=6269 RepID=A0A0M3JYV8_ANISI
LNEAKQFAEKGLSESDECGGGECAPSARQHAINEPSVSYPSVSAKQQNNLKKAILANDINEFVKLVQSNPRYLINTSSDTPAIIAEGCRYNALHIASQHGNVLFVNFILDSISDLQLLAHIYGTNEEDARLRSMKLLDAFLNTPDKGAQETALHFASKFGHLDIVERLLGLDCCDKYVLNRCGERAQDVCCRRASDVNKGNKDAILSLFNQVYIALYRPNDCSTCAVITPPGPMSIRDSDEFYKRWVDEGRESGLKDPVKGYERVGRVMAKDRGIGWRETWLFAGGVLVDLDSNHGLEKLNEHLVNNMRGFNELLIDESKDAWLNCIRKKLNFDEALDEGDDQFGDCFDGVDSIGNSDDGGDDDKKNTSLDYVTEKMAALNMDYSVEKLGEEDDTDGNKSDEQFSTPPSSPPESIFLFRNVPSKEDSDLLLALSLIDKKLIQRFGAINEYIYKLEKVSCDIRSEWPSLDSPRAKKRIKRV